jgi:hypothetical protein
MKNHADFKSQLSTLKHDFIVGKFNILCLRRLRENSEHDYSVHCMRRDNGFDHSNMISEQLKDLWEIAKEIDSMEYNNLLNIIKRF